MKLSTKINIGIVLLISSVVSLVYLKFYCRKRQTYKQQQLVIAIQPEEYFDNKGNLKSNSLITAHRNIILNIDLSLNKKSLFEWPLV